MAVEMERRSVLLDIDLLDLQLAYETFGAGRVSPIMLTERFG
jgi:hypothetical protein